MGGNTSLNFKSMVCVKMAGIYKLAVIINHNPSPIVTLYVLEDYHPRMRMILSKNFCNVGELCSLVHSKPCASYLYRLLSRQMIGRASEDKR